MLSLFDSAVVMWLTPPLKQVIDGALGEATF